MATIDKQPLTSMNITEEQLQNFKQLFPEVFTEGLKIDWDKLRLTLGETVDVGKERYGMNWPGKADCFRTIQQPSVATLVPAREESIDFDTTENLFIEGDNLEVLKLLQKSYLGKVKMIYIDPPYNTGNDFIYPDDFSENLDTYLEYTGQLDSTGKRFSTNTDRDGRYHSKWLSMIQPRLFLARNLLREDGVVFISMGEQEVHNLRALCNEIFGEENFIGCAGRISKKANNQGDYWAPNFDYVLTYCKHREYCIPFFGGINYSSYNLIEDSGPRKGEKYQLVRLYMTSLDPMRGCNNQRYYIECPDSSFVIPPGNVFPENIEDGSFIPPKSGKDKVWRWSYKSYLENKDKIVVRPVNSSNLVNEKNESTKWNVFTKTYLQDVIDKSSASPNNFIEDQINQKATHELNDLDIPFDFAKPSTLISFLADTCRVEANDIVLDFFAGSGSTAHGILDKNAKDGLNRKYILVQLPEICEIDSDEFKAGFKTIADISKERIRRVAEKIKKRRAEENKKNANTIFSSDNNLDEIDLGFKVFKLSKSNFKIWDASLEKEPEAIQARLFEHIDHISPDAAQESILYELLLKSGFELTTPIEKLTLADKTVFSIAGGQLLICLEKELSHDSIKAMAEKQPTRVICLDEAFIGTNADALKTNAVQIMKSKGVVNFRTV